MNRDQLIATLRLYGWDCAQAIIDAHGAWGVLRSHGAWGVVRGHCFWYNAGGMNLQTRTFANPPVAREMWEMLDGVTLRQFVYLLVEETWTEMN